MATSPMEKWPRPKILPFSTRMIFLFSVLVDEDAAGGKPTFPMMGSKLFGPRKNAKNKGQKKTQDSCIFAPTILQPTKYVFWSQTAYSIFPSPMCILPRLQCAGS